MPLRIEEDQCAEGEQHVEDGRIHDRPRAEDEPPRCPTKMRSALLDRKKQTERSLLRWDSIQVLASWGTKLGLKTSFGNLRHEASTCLGASNLEMRQIELLWASRRLWRPTRVFTKLQCPTRVSLGPEYPRGASWCKGVKESSISFGLLTMQSTESWADDALAQW